MHAHLCALMHGMCGTKCDNSDAGSSHHRVNEGKSLLAITEVMDRNTQTILGCWMETVDGQAKQRKVKRAFGSLRSRDEAWAQVEAIVRQKVAEEAHRRRVLLGQ